MVVSTFVKEIGQLADYRLYGRVAGVLGMLVEVAGSRTGPFDRLALCDPRPRQRCWGQPPGDLRGHRFRKRRALLLPFGSLEGVGLGCKAEVMESEPLVRPSPAWLGRVVNALGEPVDGKGPLPDGPGLPLRASPPPAAMRGGASAVRSTSACAPSTPSCPAATASAWASSPAPASASRCCCRCWRATRRPTSTSSA